jgi:copper(I)-binding protein
MKAFCILALALAAAPAVACDGLRVVDPHIPEAPPGAGALAGYAELDNTGSKPLTVDGIGTGDFASAEIHEMWMQAGMMQMRPVPRLVIAAHAKALLQPGAMHLMLIGPKHEFKEGDAAVLTFQCGPSKREVRFPVVAAAGAAAP